MTANYSMRYRTLAYFGIIGGILTLSFLSRITHVTFCEKQFPVPAGGEAISTSQVQGKNYRIKWIYPKSEMLIPTANLLIGQINEEKHVLKQEYITLKLMDDNAKGYIFTYQGERSPAYHFIAYGIVNNEAVIVQFTSEWNPADRSKYDSLLKELFSL